MARTFTVLLAASAVVLAACGCTPEKKSSQDSAADKLPPAAIPAKIWEQFSGERAMREVEKQVAFGPRPTGSAAIVKARDHIAETLKSHGWEVERQEFDFEPVPGKGSLRFVNIIGRFPRKGMPATRDTQRVILGSHYDTKRMSGIRFVGANDAGSSTGALLEMARVLALAPDLAKQIELVFFDGEEAVENFGPAESGPDGLVGSRHYAHSLREGARAKQFRFAIVWDMIGDADLTVTLPPDTPPELSAGIFAAADALGVRKRFGFHAERIIDDHTPLWVLTRIPAMDIIDFDYPPWHTSADTLDKLSVTSLETIGRVTLWLLARECGK